MSACREIPNISVIIPSFNAGHTLVRAVNSVLQQTGPSFEILIVDNNSTDNTVTVAASLAASYPTLIRLTTASVQGASAARNEGLRLARAAWIQFLDADDYLLPGKLLRHSEMVEDDVDWIIGTSVPVINGVVGMPFVLAEDPWKGLAMCRGVGDTNANFFRKSSIVEVGNYDVSRQATEDYHLYFKLLASGHKYVKDEIPGSHYVVPANYQGDRNRYADRLPFTLEVVNYVRTHYSTYYAREHIFYRTAVLAAIRMLMTVNFKAGRREFIRLFPEEIDWSTMQRNDLPTYNRLYQIFGFVSVEWVRSTASSIKQSILTR